MKVTEYAKGHDLMDFIKQNGHDLIVSERIAAVEKIKKNVQAVHGKDYILGDLKLENIGVFVDDSGHTKYKFIDLDTFVRKEKSETLPAAFTPQTCAPEVWAAPAKGNTVKGDIWSLGMVAYHVLTGSPYFANKEAAESFFQTANKDDEKKTGVDFELVGVKLKAAALSPDQVHVIFMHDLVKITLIPGMRGSRFRGSTLSFFLLLLLLDSGVEEFLCARVQIESGGARACGYGARGRSNGYDGKKRGGE